jgi:hypothetical protein
MAITNPEAIQFSNELRPRCSQIVRLKYTIDDVVRRWYLGKNNLFPNDASMIDDGRVKDTPISGADITNVIVNLIAIQSLLNATGVMDIFTKPSDPLD